MPPKKLSLFAQRMQEQKDKSQSNQEKEPSNPNVNSIGDKSFILSGPDAESIHQENAEKLAGMTEQEILKERDQLITEMEPGLIDFLRNRRRNQIPKIFTEPEKIESSAESKMAMEITAEEVASVEDVKELVNKYPHMDVIEPEKLGWIGELPQVNPPPLDTPYQARFNFEGNLLPYADQGEGIKLGLHNHGEEQERPGYTLQELIQLSRSSVLQQRIIALETLSNVLRNAFNYEKCFSEPIIPVLLDTDIFLLLRFSLDDESKPVVLVTSKALSNLLVNHIDELCLDRLLGTPLGIQQPSLSVILEMKPDDISELKDSELLKLDIVRGALRTDLLPRLRYILEVLNPESVEIKHILRSLTRIVRHTYSSAEAVFFCPRLMPVCRSLLDSSYKNSYFPEALKLFRIIASRSRDFAAALVEKYSILQPIFKFISGEVQERHPELMHLTLESFYTWQAILSYNIAVDSIREITPVLFKLLQAHLSLGTLEGSPRGDLEHATALLTTLIAISKVSPQENDHLFPLLANCSLMWLSRFARLNSTNLSISKLIGAVLQFAAINYTKMKSLVDLDLLVDSLFNTTVLEISLKSFKKYSWLMLNEYEKGPENLPSLGSIPPLVDECCCLPLVIGLTSYVFMSRNQNLMKKLVTNEYITSYIREVISNKNVISVCQHWYARQELILLINLINVYSDTQLSQIQELYHNLAFVMLSLVHSGDKHYLPQLVSKAVFNKQFLNYNAELLDEKMSQLSFNEPANTLWNKKKNLIEKAISRLDEIEVYYMKELGLMNATAPWPPITLTGQLNSTTTALPTDWPFLPILRMYNIENVSDEDLEEVVLCLEWILILEEFKPGVAQSTNVAARYCRISCVFLAGNNFFRDVTDLLEVTLQRLLCYSNDFDFETPVPGLSSFYDFYRQLLEQFAAVSYCDRVFGQYILVPLQQRHNPKYKRILWSEMAAVLRLLSTPIDNVNMNDYLIPCETDPDMLLTYLHALATGKVREAWSPIMYKIAIHHVATFYKANDDKLARLIKDRISKIGNKALKEELENYSGA